ncbi:MAG: hypothetical protein RIS36_1921 [Pseudomonadota bacterium]|jgi:lysophospholipase L1-like esterase
MPQLFIFGDSITWGAWDPDGVARVVRETSLTRHPNLGAAKVG